MTLRLPSYHHCDIATDLADALSHLLLKILHCLIKYYEVLILLLYSRPSNVTPAL
jgi:hypothetical protein